MEQECRVVQLNRTSRGVPFLGFRVFPCHMRLLPMGMRRFSAKYREYEWKYSEGIWSEREMNRHMESLTAFTDLGDCAPFGRSMIEKFGLDYDEIESPDWHKIALLETEKRFEDGNEELIDWSDAKMQLRKNLFE